MRKEESKLKFWLPQGEKERGGERRTDRFGAFTERDCLHVLYIWDFKVFL